MRVTCTDHSRVWLQLKGTWPNSPQGKARAQDAGAAMSERVREKGLGAVPRNGKADATSSTTAVTFKDLAEDWVSGKLHKQWPDHVKLKRDTANDELRLGKLYKSIGDVPIERFTITDAEKAMASLPQDRTPQTRRHYGQTIAKVLRLAVYPCKLIERSPLPLGFLPCVRSTIAFGYLYPSEDSTLLACQRVPYDRRLLYAFLAREGCRLGEALALRWCDLDLERGSVRLDANKTDDPRAWVMSPGVAEVLKAYRSDDADSADLVFQTINGDHCAKRFRTDLTTAGVDRAELHERSKNRRPIRIHDLRATFVTLALANGRTESWVADRTGHRSSTMINKYRRQARQVQELELGSLLPLNLALVADESSPGIVPKLRARQDSNLRPPASKADALSS